MEVCSVCADHATGRHYGAATCEGCKLFFKRSVKKDLAYTCRVSGCCPINKRYRNNCQYCRMKRCLAVGMRKEAVQQTKAQERKRRRTRKQPGIDFNKKSDFDTLSELITFLQNAEPYHQSSTKTDEEHTKPSEDESLSETSARLLFMTVHWAKNVAHFSDLCYNDQVSLLKANWMLVFVLNLAQWTWTADDWIRLRQNLELAVTAKHSRLSIYQVRRLEVILKKILDLEMDDAEFVLLKTLALFSPDTDNLMEPAQVQTLQTKTQRALEEYILSRYTDKANRQGQILIKLFLLRTLDSGVIEQLFFMDMIGRASIQTLVEDILRTNALSIEKKLQL